MRHRIGWSFFLVIVAALLSQAHAQNIQNFKPAVGTWNYFSVEGARVAKHGEFVPSLYINYGNQPLVERSGNTITNRIVEHLTTADLLLAVGIADRIEFGLDIPVHFVAGQDAVAFAVEEGASFGDIRLIPKLRLFGLEKDKGFGAAISVPISFPTGNKEALVGDDQFTFNPKLILEARTGPFNFAANAGVRFKPDKKTIGENGAEGDLELDDELTYGAAIEVQLGSKYAVLLSEVFGASPITNVDSESQSNPLEGLLGFRFFMRSGPVFSIGGGTGIVPDYGSPAFRVLGNVQYHDRNYDRDQDGIFDEDDRCPDDPEDKDGFEDADGCPDPDNDQDGILDPDDACPIDAEDKDGFEDTDGCPDPDNDQDKILDLDDQCPNDPENYNDWEDDDGCPDDGDLDRDGIFNSKDKCPKDPEDKDGFEDEDGCPDPDNDQDKILDKVDKCPNQPEDINGFEDEDGCPDANKMKVRVTKEKIEILDKVYFKTNKAKIKKRSYELLSQVAGVINANPQIKKIRVEGHTDSRGSDRYNKRLSQKRADSVRRHLIRYGKLDPDRLSAEGFGETRPIDTNSTKDGRANNRRVEFTIIE